MPDLNPLMNHPTRSGLHRRMKTAINQLVVLAVVLDRKGGEDIELGYLLAILRTHGFAKGDTAKGIVSRWALGPNRD